MREFVAVPKPIVISTNVLISSSTPRFNMRDDNGRKAYRNRSNTIQVEIESKEAL